MASTEMMSDQSVIPNDDDDDSCPSTKLGATNSDQKLPISEIQKLNSATRKSPWIYFKKSDKDRNKAMCLLCSKELSHNSNNSNGQLQTTTTSNDTNNNNNELLWNHLKMEHLIGQKAPIGARGGVHKFDGVISTTTRDQSSENRLQQRSSNNIIITKIPSSMQQKSNQSIMTANSKQVHHTHTNKHNRHIESNRAPRPANGQLINSRLRRSLDLADYDEILQLRMKPSAVSSNSISRNLISRLNEFSTPVARKLKFWNKKSFQVNQYDPSFKVIYLGNLGMQFLSKDDQCLEKPLNTLWNNYLVYMKTEIVMRLTICNSGLKAITRQHGLTQYWANRLVYCFTHKNYPKIFSWIYRHEGKKMRQELRCHAVFCSSPEKAAKMVTLLNQRLACALQEFKREKKSREPPKIMTKSDLSKDSNSIYLLQRTLPRTVPLRRQILTKGSANFRPPLDRSKSAPKLTSIREEDYDEEEDEECNEQLFDDEDDYGESQDEFEFEQSFEDRDDDDDDDDVEGSYAYDEDELQKLVDNLNLASGETADEEEEKNTHRVESDSLMTTVNEVTSNGSSSCATGDNSYENHSIEHERSSDRINASEQLAFNRFSSPRLSRRSSRSSREMPVRLTQLGKQMRKESSKFTTNDSSSSCHKLSIERVDGVQVEHQETSANIEEGRYESSLANSKENMIKQQQANKQDYSASSKNHKLIDEPKDAT